MRDLAQMEVPFLDLRAQHLSLEVELTAAFQRVLRDAVFVGGPELDRFESEFAAYCDVTEAVAVSSGTDALRLAYLAFGVKAGDEVITVPNTFIATTEAMSQAGGRVKFVDVDPSTLLMDPSQLEAAIGPRTVGVVPVHLFGTPADMNAIVKVARKHGLWVIEDAAQAQGARYRGARCGGLGDGAAFSFYPGKNLGACGEAGAVTSNDRARLSSVRKLRDHGQNQKYFHDCEGYNARLDSLQAAFLRIKLRRLDEWNEARRRAASLYRERLKLLSDVAVVEAPRDTSPIHHLFVVRVPRREAVMAELRKRGVGTGMHYPVPLHLQKAYGHLGLGAGAYPVAEQAAREILSLPIYPSISVDQIDYVCESLTRYFAGC